MGITSKKIECPHQRPRPNLIDRTLIIPPVLSETNAIVLYSPWPQSMTRLGPTTFGPGLCSSYDRTRLQVLPTKYLQVMIEIRISCRSTFLNLVAYLSLSIFSQLPNLHGLAGDERRFEVMRQIREHASISGFRGTDVLMWVVQLTSASHAQAHASEVCFSCSVHNSN